jgi:hypothetical protein
VCPSSRRPRSSAEDAVVVHEVPLSAEPCDAQQACHSPLAWRQESAHEQNLSVLPGAVDEERRKRNDDPGEAGGQAWHGRVSWSGHLLPSRPARFVTQPANWPKSSSEPLREVWIPDQRFVPSRLSMRRIMASRTNAAALRV